MKIICKLNMATTFKSNEHNINLKIKKNNYWQYINKDTILTFFLQSLNNFAHYIDATLSRFKIKHWKIYSIS